MLGHSRDARRTERYLDGLMDAEEHGGAEVPMDLDLDPAVLLAARELRAGLIRVHPSFRFEEGLAARLAAAAHGASRERGEDLAQAAGSSPAPFRTAVLAASGAPVALLARSSRLPAGRPLRVAGGVPGGLVASASDLTPSDAIAATASPRRLSLSARPSRPLVVGGVGVASAAISIGAVYVAWRWSRASQTPMVRAVRAARSGRAYASGHGRRAGVLHGILGVMS
jgi:hypothetical protein